MGKRRASIRNRLLRHYGNLCGYCGDEFNHERKLTIEHIIPRSRGGSNQLPNLMLTCYPCNYAKGDLTGREWFDSLGLYGVPTRRGHAAGEPWIPSAYFKICYVCFDDFLTVDNQQSVCSDLCRCNLRKSRRGPKATTPIYDQLAKEYNL